MASSIQRVGIRRQRDIFKALVELQDQMTPCGIGTQVSIIRGQIMERFGITVEALRAIEERGINSTWPPLEK